jgi:predicted PolB exonuclease-like 3'-5' exonuclease
MWTEQVVVDLESSTIPELPHFLGDIQAPPNYRDEAKIKEYIEKATAKEADKAALDPDLCRIVALAWRVVGTDKVVGYSAHDEENERKLLKRFWKENRNRQFVGYNILDFDMPVVLRRSFYLGVDAPRISVNRYRHDQIVDLMQILSYDGKLKYRSKEWYMRRLKMTNPDTVLGKDVPGLVLVGDYDTVLQHCKHDVNSEYELATRIGVIDATRSVVARDAAVEPF